MSPDISGISVKGGTAACPTGMVARQGRDLPGASWIYEGSGMPDLKMNTKCEVGAGIFQLISDC